MSETPFCPDWHESEEALPLVYLLGKLSLEWNMAEQFQTGFMWSLFGDFATGMAVSANLGNRPKQAIISELVERRGNASTILPFLKLTSRNFTALQENRNLLMHSHTIFRTDGKPEWRKATGKGPNGHISVLADADDLETIIAQIVELAQAFVHLVCFLKSAENGKTYRLPSTLEEPLRLKPFEGN